MYICNYISKKEMKKHFNKVGIIIQTFFAFYFFEHTKKNSNEVFVLINKNLRFQKGFEE